MPAFNPKTDLVDLQGKVAIVTGGNRGVGLATVRHLAHAGAKVYLAARDEERAIAAIGEVKKDLDLNGDVVWLRLDLSDPQKAKDAALEFLEKETRLDILINNAGVMAGPYETGLDGMSTMVIVNYLSPFVFTQTLLPILRSTAEQPDSDVRIVNVSSMHRYAPAPLKIDAYNDLSVSYHDRRFASWLRYAHSKLLIILWTKALQDHVSSSNITAIAIHPGGVNTFGASFPFFLRPLLKLVLADAEHGAYNSVFAAAGKEVKDRREKFKGAYVEPTLVGKQPVVREPARMAVDEGLRKELWEKTLGYTKKVGLV